MKEERKKFEEKEEKKTCHLVYFCYRFLQNQPLELQSSLSPAVLIVPNFPTSYMATLLKKF